MLPHQPLVDATAGVTLLRRAGFVLGQPLVYDGDEGAEDRPGPVGMAQLFCRPHTPDDNAEMEAFFATLKCERLYRGSYEDDPIQAEANIARFMDYYNRERLHQGIGFVTPQEKARRETPADTRGEKEGASADPLGPPY